LPFPTRTWVDVPPGSAPPVGAPRVNAAYLEALEGWAVAEVDPHLAQTLAAHGGVLIYVGASTAPPANPPTGLIWMQTDGVRRDLRNIGTSASPVWEDVSRDKLVASDLVSDYVVSGLLPAVPSPASLTATVPPGQAYVTGRRVAKAGEALTFAKAQDTYVDLDRDGAYVLAAVANGAAAPAIAANSIRLFRAVTDADVAQVVTVDIVTVLNSTVYTVRINGVDITYTSDADATEGEIALGLVAAINASIDANVAVVTAATAALAADAAATFTVTADTAGVPFTLTTDANLAATTTTANNTAKITTVADLRVLNPTIRGDISGTGGGTQHYFWAYFDAAGTESVTNGTWYKVPLASVVTGTNASGWFDAATGRLNIGESGYMWLRGAGSFASIVEGKRMIAVLYKNGAYFSRLASVAASAAASSTAEGWDMVPVTAGDYIELFVRHDDTVARNLQAASGDASTHYLKGYFLPA
jgi:hypothetical protein